MVSLLTDAAETSIEQSMLERVRDVATALTTATSPWECRDAARRAHSLAAEEKAAATLLVPHLCEVLETVRLRSDRNTAMALFYEGPTRECVAEVTGALEAMDTRRLAGHYRSTEDHDIDGLLEILAAALEGSRRGGAPAAIARVLDDISRFFPQRVPRALVGTDTFSRLGDVVTDRTDQETVEAVARLSAVVAIESDGDSDSPAVFERIADLANDCGDDTARAFAALACTYTGVKPPRWESSATPNRESAASSVSDRTGAEGGQGDRSKAAPDECDPVRVLAAQVRSSAGDERKATARRLGKLVAVHPALSGPDFTKVVNRIHGTTGAAQRLEQRAVGELAAVYPDLTSRTAARQALVTRDRQSSGEDSWLAALALGALLSAHPNAVPESQRPLVGLVRAVESHVGRPRAYITLGAVVTADPEDPTAVRDVLLDRAERSDDTGRRIIVRGLGWLCTKYPSVAPPGLEPLVEIARRTETEEHTSPRTAVIWAIGDITIEEPAIQDLADVRRALVERVDLDRSPTRDVPTLLGEFVAAVPEVTPGAVDPLVDRLRAGRGPSEPTADAIGRLVVAFDRRQVHPEGYRQALDILSEGYSDGVPARAVGELTAANPQAAPERVRPLVDRLRGAEGDDRDRLAGVLGVLVTGIDGETSAPTLGRVADVTDRVPHEALQPALDLYREIDSWEREEAARVVGRIVAADPESAGDVRQAITAVIEEKAVRGRTIATRALGEVVAAGYAPPGGDYGFLVDRVRSADGHDRRKATEALGELVAADFEPDGPEMARQNLAERISETDGLERKRLGAALATVVLAAPAESHQQYDPLVETTHGAVWSGTDGRPAALAAAVGGAPEEYVREATRSLFDGIPDSTRSTAIAALAETDVLAPRIFLEALTDGDRAAEVTAAPSTVDQPAGIDVRPLFDLPEQVRAELAASLGVVCERTDDSFPALTNQLVELLRRDDTLGTGTRLHLVDALAQLGHSSRCASSPRQRS
ncbi:hypothetical protein [Haloarcula sediminis]|uniref:hypothetical protein n=1 Tax=Haloarcula sediminis TaxID=3111777 RepID=UPI002D780777|nr:hypothetical protein [Haloarcula sp. CK38]